MTESPRSLTDIVTRLAEREPDKHIFTFLHSDRDQQTATAGRLYRDASRIAATLHERGVHAGDIVPLAFDHGYELVAAFWGAIYLGAVPTILPYVALAARPHSYLDQIGRLVRFTNATTVITEQRFEATLEQGLLEQRLAEGTCGIVGLPPPPFDALSTAAAPEHTSAPSDTPYIQFS